MLKREYDAWILDLHKIVEEHESMDDEQIASAIAKSLDQRHQLLKILSISMMQQHLLLKRIRLILVKPTISLAMTKVKQVISTVR